MATVWHFGLCQQYWESDNAGVGVQRLQRGFDLSAFLSVPEKSSIFHFWHQFCWAVKVNWDLIQEYDGSFSHWRLQFTVRKWPQLIGFWSNLSIFSGGNIEKSAYAALFFTGFSVSVSLLSPSAHLSFRSLAYRVCIIRTSPSTVSFNTLETKAAQCAGWPSETPNLFVLVCPSSFFCSPARLRVPQQLTSRQGTERGIWSVRQRHLAQKSRSERSLTGGALPEPHNSSYRYKTLISGLNTMIVRWLPIKAPFKAIPCTLKSSKCRGRNRDITEAGRYRDLSKNVWREASWFGLEKVTC